MPKVMSPERKALMDSLVEDGWPLIQMARTHGFNAHTVKRYHPEYRGMDLTDAAKLGNAARQVTLQLRRNHPVTYSRA